jgi:hypothetical protein
MNKDNRSLIDGRGTFITTIRCVCWRVYCSRDFDVPLPEDI